MRLPCQVRHFNDKNLHFVLIFYKCFKKQFLDAKKADELRQLSVYLGLSLKKSGVSTFIAPNIAKKSLETQFTDADCLGIPYTAVLNESTLDDGILGLRSIETTLEV